MHYFAFLFLLSNILFSFPLNFETLIAYPSKALVQYHQKYKEEIHGTFTFVRYCASKQLRRMDIIFKNY